VFSGTDKKKAASETKAPVVNGEVITKGELNREVNRFVQRYASQGSRSALSR